MKAIASAQPSRYTDRRQFSAGSDCRPKHEREVKRRGVFTDPVSLSGAAKITKKTLVLSRESMNVKVRQFESI